MSFQKIVIGLLLFIIKHSFSDKIGISDRAKEDMVPYGVIDEAIKFVRTSPEQKL